MKASPCHCAVSSRLMESLVRDLHNVGGLRMCSLRGLREGQCLCVCPCIAVYIVLKLVISVRGRNLVTVWHQPAPGEVWNINMCVCIFYTHANVFTALKHSKVTLSCVCVCVWLRLLPEHIVFSSVLGLLRSVQEQGSCAVPRSVLRSALYLLAGTQDKSPRLDGVNDQNTSCNFLVNSTVLTRRF